MNKLNGRVGAPSRIILRCSVLLSLIAASPLVRAGAPGVRCSTPFVFQDAAVNVVILPYTYAGAPGGHPSDAVQRLTNLIYFDTLFSNLKFGSIGAVQLAPRDPEDSSECRPDVIEAKLLGKQPGAPTQLGEGHGLVLLWGRLYEDKDGIYVQSYARFLRRNKTESVVFRVGGYSFVGAPASQTLAFAPRHLTDNDLLRIQKELDLTSEIRDAPNDQALARPLTLTQPSSGPLAYRVLQANGDWVQIQTFQSHQQGWIKEGSVTGPFHEKMPELSFTEGLVGYLNARILSNPLSGATPNSIRQVESAFARFEEFNQGQETFPVAVGKELIGILRVAKQEPSVADKNSAAELFGQASELTPDSAEALNLDAIIRISLGVQTEQKQVSHQLATALALDPQNKELRMNLLNYYLLSKNAGQVELAKEQLQPPPWNYNLTVDGYIIPDGTSYVDPVLTADRNWLHLEARYNYENLRTGSLWAGYNFSWGNKVQFNVTPMIGGVFGRTNGIAPGFEASLAYKKIEASISNEYVFDTTSKSGNFYYAWPQLTYSLVEWLHVGAVAQHTQAYHTPVNIQRGFLVGFSHRKWEFTTYVFNPGIAGTTVVLEAGVSF